MKSQRFSVSEWVRMAEQNTKAVLYLLGVVVIGCGFVGTAVACWVRWEIHNETAPILDALLWKIDKDGNLPDYLRYKARKDSLEKVAEPRMSSAGYPIWRTR